MKCFVKCEPNGAVLAMATESTQASVLLCDRQHSLHSTEPLTWQGLLLISANVQCLVNWVVVKTCQKMSKVRNVFMKSAMPMPSLPNHSTILPAVLIIRWSCGGSTGSSHRRWKNHINHGCQANAHHMSKQSAK